MSQTNIPKKAFVCGWPIKHSRSPMIHSYWLKKYDLCGSYEKIAISPDDLPKFLRGLKSQGYAGGNFTIPHKETVLQSVDKIDEAAELIGAVNTIWFDEDELNGGNTDWIGFAKNMDQFAVEWDGSEKQKKPVIVLGAGGAARGIIYALQQRGFENIILVNRTKANADKISGEFPGNIQTASFEDLAKLTRDIGLLVNTTSLGMSGTNPLPSVLIDYIAELPKTVIVSDIVYIPLQTELLREASKLGMKTVDGLGMLLHQAAPGFEKWFGIMPEVTQELRDLILNDIGEKQ